MMHDWLPALFMGLAGAGHCLMMCGGIAAAVTGTTRPWQVVVYNLGRITSYAIAGAIIAATLGGLANVAPHGLIVLRILAAFVLVAFGLYLGQWWFGLRHLERLGLPWWRKLQPWAARLRQGQVTTPGLFLAGMLWGWLPCGLVYSALSWAALSGSATSGAFYMLLFGLGTFPAMVGFGWFSRSVQQLLQAHGFRQLMGGLMILYGLWTLIIALKQLQVR